MQAGARLTKVAVPIDGRVAVLDPMAMVSLVQDTLDALQPVGGDRRELPQRASSGGTRSASASGIRTRTSTRTRPAASRARRRSSSARTRPATALITNGWVDGDPEQGRRLHGRGRLRGQPAELRLDRAPAAVRRHGDDRRDTAGAMTIPISPAIIPDGNLQTVSASPANGAAIIPLGVDASRPARARWRRPPRPTR